MQGDRIHLPTPTQPHALRLVFLMQFQQNKNVYMHSPIYLKRERWYCTVLNTLSKGSKRALAIRILTYFKVFLKKIL